MNMKDNSFTVNFTISAAGWKENGRKSMADVVSSEQKEKRM
jgi:hypothetical protein